MPFLNSCQARSETDTYIHFFSVTLTSYFSQNRRGQCFKQKQKAVLLALQSEKPFLMTTWHRCLRDEVVCPASAVANLSFYLRHVWGCYVVMIVNSKKGVWRNVLSEIYVASLPPPPPPPLIACHLLCGWLFCMLKPLCGGGVVGWRLSQERQPRLLQRHGTWSQIKGTPPQNTAQ